jgi:hypothetical protein
MPATGAESLIRLVRLWSDGLAPIAPAIAV